MPAKARKHAPRWGARKRDAYQKKQEKMVTDHFDQLAKKLEEADSNAENVQ